MVFGPQSSRSSRHGRRIRLKRKLPRPTSAGVAWVKDPPNIHALLVAAVFTLAAAALLTWSRDIPRFFDGEVAAVSRVNRIDYPVPNEVATAQRREDARKAAPRVYDTNTDYVERLRAAIEGLPLLVRDKADLSEMDPGTAERYGLTPSSFAALRQVSDPDSTALWRSWTDRLLRTLTVGVPIVPTAEFDAFSTAVKRVVLAADPTNSPVQLRALPLGSNAIQLRDGAAMRPRLIAEAVEAGFPDELARVAVGPIIADPQPTLGFDAESTARLANEAAAAVQSVLETHPRGEKIFVEGDVLTPDQVAQVELEHRIYSDSRGTTGLFERAAGSLGMSVVLALLLLAFTAIFDRPLYRDWRKLAVVFALILLPTAIAAPCSWTYPRSTIFCTLGANLFATGILTIVYGARTGLLVVLLQTGLAVLAVGAGAGFLVADVAACTVFALSLRDIRQRSALVTASTAAALAAGAATMTYELFSLPSSSDALKQTLIHGAGALVVAFCVGFVLMGLLPSIERLFGTVTGLTLSELRDPKQPLLRELQQRAPGTWNHSLQIANIAETAAESIGADGLLVYVGALYHDIGKMNKPEYFVENQMGVNRHDRLSPAMSLLVIVGHVKDGLELAVEYSLPRQVRQFIESHHGTTLVEYFFHAAQRRAGADADEVNEADFRYPGPKPQTKEAAVLMLSDAVESASRALSEPTPARIEQLVRDLSHKRLVDGQFDESTLTFRELRTVEDSVIKSLNAIYHGRISYPSQRDSRESRSEMPLPKAAG